MGLGTSRGRRRGPSPVRILAGASALACAIGCAGLLLLSRLAGAGDVLTMLAAIALASLAAGAAVWIAARRMLAAAVAPGVEAIDRLAAGDLSRPALLPAGFAGLEAAVERCRQALAEQREARERRERDVVEAEHEHARADMARQSAIKVHAAIARMFGTAIGRLARGDLSGRITVELPRDYRPFRDDFNALADGMRTLLAEAGVSGARLGERSDELANAAATLQARAEKRAARAQSDAGMLRKAAADLFDGRTPGEESVAALVGRAREGADRGRAAGADAVDAMAAIEQSSQGMGRIVSLVEDIAFQINVLALNAGIEASRAGEAGKGFMAVAADVRALAQRSGEAAGEVKALVDGSAAHVRAGALMVGKVGEVADGVGAVLGALGPRVDAMTGKAEAALRLALHTVEGVGTAASRDLRVAGHHAELAVRLRDEAASLAGFGRGFRAPDGRSVGSGDRPEAEPPIEVEPLRDGSYG